MCEVGAVVAIAAAIGTAVQQGQNQRRMASFQSKQQATVAGNASRAAESNYLALLDRLNQSRQAAAAETFDATRAADRAQATLVAGSESAGIGGSTGDLRIAIAQQAAQDHAIRLQNSDWQTIQIMRQFDQVGTEQQGRINAAVGSPINGPDWVGILGRLGSDLAGSYENSQKRAEIRRGG